MARYGKVVLKDFKSRMEAWLSVHGKGPLSNFEMSMLDGLPGCIPEEVETVEASFNYVDDLLEDKPNNIPSFTQKIKSSPDWNTMHDLGQSLGFDEAGLPELNDCQLQKSGEVVCPYIKEEAIQYLITFFLSGGWEECLAGLHATTSETYFENRSSLPVARLNECSGGALFQLTTGELLWRTPDALSNDTYFIFDADQRQWISFKLPPPNCVSCDLNWLAQQIQVTGFRYLTPIEDIVILMEGRDL